MRDSFVYILVTHTKFHVQVIFCIFIMYCGNTIFSSIGMVRQEIQEETDRITGRTKMISPVPIHLSIYSPNGTPFICYTCVCVCLYILFTTCYNICRISIMHKIRLRCLLFELHIKMFAVLALRIAYRESQFTLSHLLKF